MCLDLEEDNVLLEIEIVALNERDGLRIEKLIKSELISSLLSNDLKSTKLNGLIIFFVHSVLLTEIQVSQSLTPHVFILNRGLTSEWMRLLKYNIGTNGFLI